MDALLITTDIDVLHEGSAAERMIQEYAPLGKHIMVFVITTSESHASARRIGSSIWIVPIYGYVGILAAYKALRMAQRELYFQRTFQVQIIDVHDAYLSALVGWLLARRFHRPLHVRHLEFAQTPSSIAFVGPVIDLFWNIVARFFLGKADSISTDSDHVRANLMRVSKDWDGRSFLLPRFVDVAALKDKTALVDLRERYPQYKIILLAVSPLRAEYNLQLAIQTIAGVVAGYKFAGLVIVGDGPERGSLQSLAKKLGVGDHVAFEPWASDLAAYYKSAHIFLVTAPHEEYGTTIAEAAAASCAIISTNVGLAASFIKNGESGYICKPGDTECFIKTALLLINHPATRDSIRMNGMLAVESFMTKPDPAVSTDIRKLAWEAAAKHFDVLPKTRKQLAVAPKPVGSVVQKASK